MDEAMSVLCLGIFAGVTGPIIGIALTKRPQPAPAADMLNLERHERHPRP